uniref:LivJ protein n=1 Tax=Escherichia coli TaxID=562 RepID=Q47342_ECOLX|nr:ORF19; putative [Escherichia coli str. K-12 substr. W3110]
MKLTIIRLEKFSDQDRIDLAKDLGREYSPSSLQVDDNHRIYAARLTSACSRRAGNLKRHRGSTGFPARAGSHPPSRWGNICWKRFCVTILAFHAGGWRLRRGRSRCDDGVYAGAGVYGTTGRLGEVLIVKSDFKSVLPDALRLSGLQCVLQFTDFFGSCRPDKAFTPHPA